MSKPKDRVVNLEELRTNCQKCSLYQLCMPMGLEDGDLTKLDKVIKRRHTVEKGEYLFRMGDAFKSVHAIRSGSFKVFTSNYDGQDQVISLHLPGELLGMDAISTQHHSCSAIALETSSVCEMPFDRLESLSHEIPGLQHHLLKLMSEELRHDQCHMTLLAKMPVEARLASFLINLSERYKARGYSSTEFNLSMSRNDIANMLGMAMETISRLFTHFQEQGILSVERKHVVIRDLNSLQAITLNCNQPASEGDNASHTA